MTCRYRDCIWSFSGIFWSFWVVVDGLLVVVVVVAYYSLPWVVVWL